MYPVKIYCGQLTDVTFLSSLLEAESIRANLVSDALGGHDEVAVYVADSDVARARPIVEDFETRGKKTPRWWQ